MRIRSSQQKARGERTRLGAKAKVPKSDRKPIESASQSYVPGQCGGGKGAVRLSLGGETGEEELEGRREGSSRRTATLASPGKSGRGGTARDAQLTRGAVRRAITEATRVAEMTGALKAEEAWAARAKD